MWPQNAQQRSCRQEISRAVKRFAKSNLSRGLISHQTHNEWTSDEIRGSSRNGPDHCVYTFRYKEGGEEAGQEICKTHTSFVRLRASQHYSHHQPLLLLLLFYYYTLALDGGGMGSGACVLCSCKSKKHPLIFLRWRQHLFAFILVAATGLRRVCALVWCIASERQQNHATPPIQWQFAGSASCVAAIPVVVVLKLLRAQSPRVFGTLILFSNASNQRTSRASL